jgi:hypothetical protein
MATTKYEYDIATQTAAAKVLYSKLHGEIESLALPTFVGTRPGAAGKFFVEFDAAISAPDKVTLDVKVLSHTGTKTSYVFKVPSTVLSGEKTGISSTYEVIGFIVSSPDAFVPVVANCVGRIVGQTRTTGLGAHMRVVEEPDTALGQTGDVVLGTHDVPDGLGVWTVVKFFTTVAPRVGTHQYRLEAEKGGATNFDLRGLSMSLLEAQTQQGVTA